MNISIKHYAKILYKLIDSKSRKEAEKIISEFAAVLIANNAQGKLKKIIEEFGRIWNKERGVVEAEISSAKELDKDIVKLLNSYIAKLSGAKEVIMSERVDKNLLGGAVIKYGDRVLDSSLKMRIEELRCLLIK